jgi:bacillithiol biosynthesis cysteine-adding enzyme BshC
MDIDCLPFKNTGYFTPLICDYLDQKKELEPFYNRFPSLENFKGQIEEKATSFQDAHRDVLYDALQNQYINTVVSKKTQEHLKQLKEPITFTVVTGHQLNLFTGPLYFLYKIISTINLTTQLKKKYPKYNFVPIYWMATEDHDFDEINYFNFKGKKLQWNREAAGAVGPLKNEGLNEVFEAFSNELGSFKNAETLKELFKKSYLEHDTLTEATRFLANELFGDQGLVIVDGDDAGLKRLLIPYVKQDIFDQTSFDKVSTSIEDLAAVSDAYGIQVNPREINYFYLIAGLRERIIANGDDFAVVDSDIKWTKSELEKEIDDHPERFSPNVITRPLYQEVILPNLCYIGGGGEIAYWLELKTNFEAMQVPFPVLLLRNSVLAITEKQNGKLEKMNVSVEDLFLKQHTFINKKIRTISNIDIDFSPQKQLLEDHFKSLYKVAEQTDASFLGAVKAQELKQKKGLDNLEKRLLKAQKRKLKDHVVRMTDIQNELFPGQSLQERNLNFSELYLEFGEDLIPTLIKALQPLDLQFTILKV